MRSVAMVGEGQTVGSTRGERDGQGGLRWRCGERNDNSGTLARIHAHNSQMLGTIGAPRRYALVDSDNGDSLVKL